MEKVKPNQIVVYLKNNQTIQIERVDQAWYLTVNVNADLRGQLPFPYNLSMGYICRYKEVILMEIYRILNDFIPGQLLMFYVENNKLKIAE